MNKQLLIMAVVILSLTACIVEPSFTECPNGAVCAEGLKCIKGATHHPYCTPNDCGDAEIDGAEECDTGGVETADCNLDCSKSHCGDGKLNVAAHEQCDNGNDNSDNADCLPGCKNNVCGDGYVNKLGPNKIEACDEGSRNGETVCSYGQATCQICAADCSQEVTRNGPSCGDEQINGPEVCDNGQSNGAISCTYGQATCEVCSSDCLKKLPATGPYCGDGIVNGSETCDLGAARNGQLDCPYGMTGCEGCSADCSQVIDATETKPHFCGDDVIDLGNEVCDNSISFVCGTCMNCQTEPPAALAEGEIEITDITKIKDGETFTITDGTDTVEFGLYKNAVLAAPVVGIDISNMTKATEIAGAIYEAIFKGVQGGTTPRLQAIKVELTDNVVNLTNRNGRAGNQKIKTKYLSSDHGFTVEGISGGNGCGLGVACAFDGDCVSGKCDTGQTTPTCIIKQ